MFVIIQQSTVAGTGPQYEQYFELVFKYIVLFLSRYPFKAEQINISTYKICFDRTRFQIFLIRE